MNNSILYKSTRSIIDYQKPSYKSFYGIYDAAPDKIVFHTYIGLFFIYDMSCAIDYHLELIKKLNKELL
jgi:hypothetical protein